MSESIYRDLYRIRRVEEEIARVYPTDKIQSPVHLSIGQEAISVGVCQALKPSDVVFGSYRSHAMYLAKGGDLKKMIAELYGKATGCAHGKAGSMHLIDVGAGVMGASAVVATTIPLAVGYALGVARRKQDKIVANFFGDGAVEEGVFHESLNYAALKRLPIVFICENNELAIHSRQHHRQAVGKICDLAQAHGIPAERIEEMDVLAIRDKVSAAVEAIRAGKSGPRFFECMCYRWLEHVGPGDDYQAGYRARQESLRWIENDQVKRIGAMIPAAGKARIERDVEVEIQGAFEFAEASAFPIPAELYTDVFKDD